MLHTAGVLKMQMAQQPVYYPFSEVVLDNGRRLVSSDLQQDADGRYQIDYADFEAKIVDNQVKLFLLCSPHNPVGRVWSREELLTLNQNGTYLPSHCDRLKVRGIDMTAGSLGQGISAAAGMAKAAKMDGSDVCVYTVIGDGECQEGEVWEAALFAPHQKLDNLTVLLDYNKGQVDGFVADIEAVAPHEPK